MIYFTFFRKGVLCTLVVFALATGCKTSQKGSASKNNSINLKEKQILKRISYEAPYIELCTKIKNGDIPPVKLISLANLLKIQYDDDISLEGLCTKIRHALVIFNF